MLKAIHKGNLLSAVTGSLMTALMFLSAQYIQDKQNEKALTEFTDQLTKLINDMDESSKCTALTTKKVPGRLFAGCPLDT